MGGSVREASDRPPHTRIGRRSGALLVTVGAGVLVGSAMGLVPVDRVVYHPGPLYDTLGDIGDDRHIINIDEDLTTYPTEGHLWFTTIHLEGGPGDRLNVWEWLRSELDPAATVVPREQVFPEDISVEQVREENTALMQHSQQDAAVVALRADGITVPEDILVARVIVDAPADGVLHVEDQILQVDGEPMANARAVQDRLQEVEPGDSVPVTLVRDGEETTIDVPTTKAEDSSRTIVGVYLAPRYELPYDVTIDAGNVGGPSAGLMFSLAVYDEITPGALTGGRSVAGTGTISSTGQVGGIGGITQKMYAADRAGAALFLAPESNCDEVVETAPDGLAVAAVGSFEQALDVMEQAAQTEDIASLDLPACDQVLQDGPATTG